MDGSTSSSLLRKGLVRRTSVKLLEKTSELHAIVGNIDHDDQHVREKAIDEYLGVLNDAALFDEGTFPAQMKDDKTTTLQQLMIKARAIDSHFMKNNPVYDEVNAYDRHENLKGFVLSPWKKGTKEKRDNLRIVQTELIAWLKVQKNIIAVG